MPVLSRLSLGAVAALAGFVFGSAPVCAADALPTGVIGSPAALESALGLLAQSPGTVVAEVNGKPVTYAEVIEAIRALPRVNAEATFPQVFRAAANLVIARKALADKARAAGLPSMPAVQRRIEDAQDRVLGDELLRRSLAPNLLEPAVRSTYDESPVSKAAATEVQLRVIAVDSRPAADALIQELKGGADFADLARRSSKDPSAANGGLLEYHWRGALAPELAAIGFAMDVGEMTAYPVRSGGRWMVVRCDGRRTRTPLSFAEARSSVEQDILRIGMSDLRTLAMKQSSISYYGLMGKSPPPSN